MINDYYIEVWGRTKLGALWRHPVGPGRAGDATSCGDNVSFVFHLINSWKIRESPDHSILIRVYYL